jgi:trimethylamine--corrinoid protein Co-methyltransferase
MRRLWMPRLFDRSEWSEWDAAGRPGPREAARERMRELLDRHRPEYLEPDVDAEIRRILERYEREGTDGHG